MPVLTGPRRAARAGVLTLGLIARGVHATQPANEPAGDPPAPWNRASIEPPSPARALAAFELVDGWVRRWKAPDEHEAALLVIDPVPSAEVTLRLGGMMIGRGQDSTGDALTIWRAARAAIGQATTLMPVEFDALRDEEMLETAARVTIGLELAGELIPFDADTRQDVALAVTPGVEGIAVRINERVGRVFPMTMLTTGLEPARAFSSALGEAAQDARAGLLTPADARNEHGASFYRFATIHAGQPAAGLPAVFLDRGGRVVEASRFDALAIASFAQSVADHMIGRAWPEDTGLGFGGTMHPTRRENVHDPEAAPPEDQALAALALWRFSRIPGLPASSAERSRRAVVSALEALARVEPLERSPASDAPAAAACVGVLSVLLADGATLSPAVRDLRHACELTLMQSVDAQGEFSGRLPAGARGMACWALARRALLLPEGAERDAAIAQATSAARGVYRGTEPGALVTHMPFLGWAEQALAPADAIPSSVALREMRATIWRHQLQPGELAIPDRDLAGGIVFSASGMPLPTWETARGVVFAAAMIRDDRLTDRSEAPAELVRVVMSLRFLRQLTLDDSMRYMLPLAERSLGGVRAAGWDQSLPLDASAMTLLAITEFLESLRAMRP